MPIQKRLIRGVLLAALLLPAAVLADAILKPLPTPDLGKLAPAQAKEIGEERAAFDKAYGGLVGPPLAQAYADIGVVYARAGFKDVAAVAFYDATQADPADGRWPYLSGIIARELKQDAEARTAFETALARDKVYLPIRYRLSDTLVGLGDVEGARKVLDATTREYPEQAIAFAMLGQLELRAKRYTQAIESLTRALKIEPQANQLYKPLAEAYAGVGNAQAAKDAEAKIGNTPPQLADPLAVGLYGRDAPRAGDTPLREVRRLAATGKVDAARTKLAEMLRDHPDDIDALTLQARLEASVGNLAVARTAADQALKRGADNASALLARGIVYEYAGDDDQAYAQYQRAVHADARLPMARLLLGNAEMRRGHYPQAAEQYRQLTTLQPGDAQAHAHLVAAEVASGQCMRALAAVGAAQVRNAKDGDLMQIFVRLASTCPGAKQEERDMAFDYAQALYDQQADAGDASALALAMAAHGKFKEAQQYQAEAIFDAVRSGDNAAAEQYKSTQASFVAGKVPDRPWPDQHMYFKPPMLTPQRPVTAPAKQ